MNRFVCTGAVVVVLVCGVVAGRDAGAAGEEAWLNKYPMSFFTKTRTAKTVGKDRLGLSLKWQSVECDEVFTEGCYSGIPDTARNDVFKTVLTAKYGWAENQHLVFGIPYMWVDFESATKTVNSDGLGNLFAFNKWNFLRETRAIPAMSFDVWYYFDNGDGTKKLGSNDDSVKATVAVSKAWGRVNAHLNPGYRWNLHDGCDIGEINAGAFARIHPKLMLGMEYNYTDKEKKGHCHDLVPGLLWKPARRASVKLGAVMNLDSSMAYRDELGAVGKFFWKF